MALLLQHCSIAVREGGSKRLKCMGIGCRTFCDADKVQISEQMGKWLFEERQYSSTGHWKVPKHSLPVLRHRSLAFEEDA